MVWSPQSMIPDRTVPEQCCPAWLWERQVMAYQSHHTFNLLLAGLPDSTQQHRHAGNSTVVGKLSAARTTSPPDHPRSAPHIAKRTRGAMLLPRKREMLWAGTAELCRGEMITSCSMCRHARCWLSSSPGLSGRALKSSFVAKLT